MVATKGGVQWAAVLKGLHDGFCLAPLDVGRRLLRHRPKRFRLASMLALSLLGTAGGQAADPQPYAVGIVPTGQIELDQALKDSSILLELQQKAPVGPFGLLARAREDADRFVTALRSFGYYEGKILMLVDGRMLDDPNLPTRLRQAPAKPVKVAVSVDPGPLFHLRNIEIRGILPEHLKKRLDLAPGAPALAPKVLEARDRLLDALREDGYALAKVAKPQAILDSDANVLDLVFEVEVGPRVDLGAISVTGLKRMEEPFVRRRLTVRPGQRFDPREIDKAKQDLSSLGVFSSVRATAAEGLDDQGRIPVTLAVTERPLHAVSGNAAYSTDLGASLSATWQHFNLLGEAERLSVTGGVGQLGGDSTRGIGYNLATSFLKPDFLLRDQSLQADLAAVKQSLIAYDQKGITGSVLLNRRFADHWSYSIGLSGEQSRITQEGVTRDYTLLGLPLNLKYDDSNSLLDPTQGVRAVVSLTPMHSLAGSGAPNFILMQVAGSAYLDLGEPGRSVLALRGLIGDAEGASQFELPPNKRYYAGGSATVRGFKYQSIGPQFREDRPQGGTSVAAGTVEYRQRILDQYGAAFFVDVGQVNAGGTPFSDTWRVGAGVGARYYTSIGPIRLDVAMPVNKLPGGSSFELYIGLGQAF
ncbi:MAG: hypothetical protein H6R26_74 [Proteobacteria bacterium]|nr:hypothetical protein [Pseudomonadota bacterium]